MHDVPADIGRGKVVTTNYLSEEQTTERRVRKGAEIL